MIQFIGGAILIVSVTAVVVWWASEHPYNYVPPPPPTGPTLSGRIAEMVGAAIGIGLVIIVPIALSLMSLYFFVRFVKWAWGD